LKIDAGMLTRNPGDAIALARRLEDAGFDEEGLLKHADIALTGCKQKHTNAFAYFTAEMNAMSRVRLMLENSLYNALNNDEMFLVFQAKVCHDGQISGFEALLRWSHPKAGLVSPAEFIPLLEETGLIVSFGEWVLKKACEWRKQAGETLQIDHSCNISVNISSKQFQCHHLAESIQQILQETGIPPQQLELEITESSLMQNIDDAQKTLQKIKAMGVSVAIDDFGTGYSSLAYLKTFPIDTLKIDQMFIRNICTDSANAAIANTIINLAHNLNLNVIAEGVDSEEKLQYLQTQGCHQFQGFYFSKPLLPEQLPQRIHNGIMQREQDRQ